jgi:serine/threonine-protein kinase SRPK3
VFELLGPTVNIYVTDYYDEEEGLDTETILEISTQLLQAVAFMHEAGYAHGGIVDHSLFASQPKQTFYT